MPAERFLDTNNLLYAYDLEAGRKREIALEVAREGWLNLGTTAISVQVLQEFYVNFVRMGKSHAVAVEIIQDLSLWPAIDNTLERFGQGLGIKERFQISLWDAMILAAAKASGARELFSEDLSHGQDYGGVTVINPFFETVAS